MDKERVIAIFLTPIVVWLWGLFMDYLERRQLRKDAAMADYHSCSVVVSTPLRLGSDGGSSDDGGTGGSPAERPQQ